MTRIVASATVPKTQANDSYADYLAVAVRDLFAQIKTALAALPQAGLLAVRQAAPAPVQDAGKPKTKHKRGQGLAS